MFNAATAYASSASTDVAAYEDLPGHHLLAVTNLIATTNDESYHGSASELPPATSHRYTEWDFSGVPNPVMLQRFLDVADYWFGCFDDSSAGSYDPARECFMVAIGDLVDGTSVAGPGDGEAPQNPGTSVPRNPGPSAPPTSPARGTDINAQLAQACELEAKLAEEYRAVRLIRASIAGEASARGESVRELGKQAHERINADFNVDDPNTPPRASQKLIAATMLLRAMPAPSTPEVRNMHREAHALIEQATVQQAKSSASRIRQQAVRGTTLAPRAKRHPSTQMAWQGNQPTRAERQSASGSLIRADRLRTATPATLSTPAEWATQRHERRQATTPGRAGTTTAARIARRCRSP
jgi:hypothetical protein